MGLMRDPRAAGIGVRRLLSVNAEHYMGMLLLALLYTVQADYGSAKTTIGRILTLYEEDIVGALLYIVLRQITENTVPVLPTSAVGASLGEGGATRVAIEGINRELAIVLARVEAYSNKVVSHPIIDAASGDHATPTLKRLCLGRVLGERPPDKEVIDPHVAQRQAAHYWSFLAYVCVRLSAYRLAEVVIEAGLNFIANQPTPHPRAFADLLCSTTRLSLLRLGGRLPAFTMIHEFNLLGTFIPFTNAESSFTALLMARTEDSGGEGATNSLKGAVEPIDQRELSIAFTNLLQVVEMCPNHADAYLLMGILRLLDASKPDLPKSERHVKLLEAAVYFEQCIGNCPYCVEAYLGLGNVRKLQEADEVALDLYATASEVWFRQPLISFEEFMFLFDRHITI
ncbi:unnamed protein product [Phytomonas sp. Hart1]|nr:unnamed protein product [Phytomonas sp. Hart1]|eukprot:CCW68430.1 unnamed protein product [Phytomonas sp. isolate Hart1]